MENTKYIMVRYGELGTKGKNRKEFIRTLANNIRHALRAFNLHTNVTHDHIYIDLTDDSNMEEICALLKDISGIRSFSIVYKVDPDLSKITEFCRDFDNCL